MAATFRRAGDGRVSNDTQRNDLDGWHSLHHGLYLHIGIRKGVGTVNSYKDYMRLKWLKPIVIERTKKLPGDLVLPVNYKPAEIAR